MTISQNHQIANKDLPYRFKEPNKVKYAKKIKLFQSKPHYLWQLRILH